MAFFQMRFSGKVSVDDFFHFRRRCFGKEAQPADIDSQQRYFGFQELLRGIKHSSVAADYHGKVT